MGARSYNEAFISSRPASRNNVIVFQKFQTLQRWSATSVLLREAAARPNGPLHVTSSCMKRKSDYHSNTKMSVTRNECK
jgi:hypothetical protein